MKMVCVKVKQPFLKLTRRSKKLIIIFLFVVSNCAYMHNSIKISFIKLRSHVRNKEHLVRSSSFVFR